MIRRKVSNGLLRAAAQAQASSASAPASAAQAVMASPMGQQQTANLASSVLLSSQRNWKGETVNTLKNELKKRGLSQQGNKATLVARLSSAETSQLLPPMPRSLSTSSKASAAAKKSSTPSKQDDTATVNKDEKEMTTGPQISSKRDEADPLAKPTKEQLTAAPGLPESGKVEPSSGERLSVKMPGPPVEESKEQAIPLEPDNFRSNDQIPQERPATNDTPGPKVMTVASASTHLSGGPVSAVHESSDSSTLDAQGDAEGSLPGSFEGAGKALASAVNSLSGMSRTAGEFSRVLIPQINLPKSSGSGSGGKGQGEYKAPEGGLNPDERKGLWVLGGIVGLGLLLGGGSSGASAEAKAKAAKLAAAAKAKVEGGSAGGPKGDAEWAKASGAGVVGHGSRKE